MSLLLVEGVGAARQMEPAGTLVPSMCRASLGVATQSAAAAGPLARAVKSVAMLPALLAKAGTLVEAAAVLVAPKLLRKAESAGRRAGAQSVAVVVRREAAVEEAPAALAALVEAEEEVGVAITVMLSLLVAAAAAPLLRSAQSPPFLGSAPTMAASMARAGTAG